MMTDFLLHAPHHDLRATLTITGTRDEFIELRAFLESSKLRDTRYSKTTNDVLDELEEIILNLSR